MQDEIPKQPSKHDKYNVAKSMARMPEVERPFAAKFFAEMANNGAKPATIYHYAVYISQAYEILGDKLLSQATEDDVLAIVSHYRERGLATATLFYRCGMLRKYLRCVLGLDSNADLPKGIRKALKVKRPAKTDTAGQVMADSDFEKLLDQGQALAPKTRIGALTEVRNRALLWMLRDGGFRLSECLGLRVGSIRERDGGVVEATMPVDGKDMKTGPRTVFVKEAVPALMEWLAVHPYRNRPEMPLFGRLSNGSKRDGGYIRPENVERLLEKLQQRAGIRGPNGTLYTPHDFRHTCLTEKVVKHGWTTEHLKPFAGWKKDSTMAGIYVQIGNDDLLEKVRTDQARRVEAAPSVLTPDLLAAALRQLMQGGQIPADAVVRSA